MPGSAGTFVKQDESSITTGEFLQGDGLVKSGNYVGVNIPEVVAEKTDAADKNNSNCLRHLNGFTL